MPGLTVAELDEFLAEPGNLLRIGTIGRDGMPRVVPVWFEYSEGKLWFTPRAKSAWFDDLRANPAVCCTIDESSGESRKLVARGHAVMEHDLGDDDVWRDRYRRIACRYTPTQFAEAYIQDTINEPRALYSLALVGADTSTWRMPFREGENPLAVWSSQYYHR